MLGMSFFFLFSQRLPFFFFSRKGWDLFLSYSPPYGPRGGKKPWQSVESADIKRVTITGPILQGCRD